ncbi:MAG: nucleotidyltransferase domain-containing protein [Anaerolineae bacterium]|uniref:nucleotidyltransferase domain-containing protein n=1 Tax=Candidatus Amarolinea dominans TaxID=3140696 RepID=UPI001D369697|nr:aminoglycoside 6-adenylyltransferase [Anaerolineae bacterium]
MPFDKVHRFLNEFVEWAEMQPDIQAVALVGSHARNAATESSDVDLVVITRQPDEYLRRTEWAQRFGQVLHHHIEDYGLLISLRVWYADGPEVEYGLTDERWSALPLDKGTQRVITDGMRILFERTPILSGVQPGR